MHSRMRITRKGAGHGDVVALELLRGGKRGHPRVSRYFDHLGIPT